MKPRRSKEYGPRKADPNRRSVCNCGHRDFDWSTNGDGASQQICKACGAIYAVGRYYQDHAVGVRVIAYSMLSALVTSNPKPT